MSETQARLAAEIAIGKRTKDRIQGWRDDAGRLSGAFARAAAAPSPNMVTLNGQPLSEHGRRLTLIKADRIAIDSFRAELKKSENRCAKD